MRASTMVSLSAFSLALGTGAAWAEDAKPVAAKTIAARGSEITVEVVKIKGRPPHPQVSVDITRLVPRTPLPELRKPLVDRIAAAVEKDPF